MKNIDKQGTLLRPREIMAFFNTSVIIKDIMYFPNFAAFEKLTKEGNLVPIYREILADMETPVSVLRRLCDKAHAFLLESVEGGEKWGRYTFLGFDPKAIFKIRNDEVIIENGGEIIRQKHLGDPLKFLKEMMGRYRPVTVAGCPRFYGGAVGFFGYDVVRYFERLPASAKDDLKIEDAIFLLTDTMIIFDNIRHTIKAVACAFTGEKGELREIYDACTGRIEELIALVNSPDVRDRRRGGGGGCFRKFPQRHTR